MKYSLILAGLALPMANAFPAIADSVVENLARNAAKVKAKRQYPDPPYVPPPFDPSIQYVSNTGEHAFNPPSGSDQRGPCPGLNSMANHGYFPHNGIGSMSDFIVGTEKAFGMAVDLSTFLAIYGSVFDGNLQEYSIGGPYPGMVNGGGLLGEPYGLAGSHNKYEGDVSPVRGDLYQYGNDYENQVSQFRQLYELGMQNGGLIDLELLGRFRSMRFNQSISENPYFFNAPFSGVIASNAAWTFVYRFMANKSAEYPEGQLDLETLKYFYSMKGDYPNFEYTPGYETLPDNWYKRHPTDDYSIPYLIADAFKMVVDYPQLASLGGNTGKPNSFVGIEPLDLTGGVYNAQNLFEGNNFFCYGLEVANQETPDILSGLFTDIDPAMDMIGAAFNNVTNSLGCPQLNNINRDQFKKYPGYTKLRKDGTYPSH